MEQYEKIDVDNLKVIIETNLSREELIANLDYFELEKQRAQERIDLIKSQLAILDKE